MAALRVERLVLRGYRNLVDLDLSLGARFNVLSGENGQGKSNLLEAVYYLGSLQSFRGAKREDLIGHGASRALLAARIATHPAPVKVQVRLSRTEGRQLAIDGKRPRSSAAWVSALPMVLFHPGDVGLVGGPPEARRAFLDRILEQMDVGHGRTAAGYKRALRSRNRLLKQGGDPRSITAYDELLASAGAVLGRSRARLALELTPRLDEVFREVAGEELALEVSYRPRVEPTPEAIRRALGASLAKDRARGFTAEGPHADDLALTVGARGARHHASQGQHRMMVLALKVAELDVLARHLGRVPVLLLDDVSSELDPLRNRRLLAVLERIGAQVLLTTTQRELIRVEHDRLDFRVSAGCVEPA